MMLIEANMQSGIVNQKTLNNVCPVLLCKMYNIKGIMKTEIIRMTGLGFSNK